MGAVGIVSRRRVAALAALAAPALFLLLAVGGHRPTDRSPVTPGAAIETVAGLARPTVAAVPPVRHAGSVGRPTPTRDRLSIVRPSGVAATTAAGWVAALVIVGGVLLGRRPTSGLRSRAPPVAWV